MEKAQDRAKIREVAQSERLFILEIINKTEKTNSRNEMRRRGKVSQKENMPPTAYEEMAILSIALVRTVITRES